MARSLDLETARPDLAGLVDDVLAGGEPIVLVRDGRPSLVIVSWDDYDLLVGAVQQLSRDWEGNPA